MTQQTSQSSQTPDDCLFCRIAAGDLPAELVAQTELSVAFRDISPLAPVHILVVPRRHVPSVGALASASAADLADVFRLAQQVAEQEGVGDAHRLIANTGAGAGQTVFHAHVHVLAGEQLTERSMV
ncbi:MAG: histidine triad protein [Humibacillus sp.]|nr:histidine triad protein [Humibacillus sp.]